MKNRWMVSIAALLIVAAAFAFISKPVKSTGNSTNGFALIELFTSEGCSSCPSADRLVAKIAKEYQGKEVYVLAYHVDYWNRLGWKDQFSSPQYSARQSSYSNYLNLDGVYTPQAVVNGRTEFVGSDEGRMQAAIQQNLSKAPVAELALTNLRLTGSKASLHFKTTGLQGANTLMLAVIKKYAETQVKAGENSGRLLPHINIVQKLQSFEAKADGAAELTLPDGFNSKDWAIVGFIQNTRNGEILAVNKPLTDGKEIAAIK